jgi:hypothetical protein
MKGQLREEGTNNVGTNEEHLGLVSSGNFSCGTIWLPVRVRVTLRLTVSQPVRLGVEPLLGLMTRF